MGHLTKNFINKLEPPAEGHDTYWDDSPKGLGLRVMASGHKSFILFKRFRGRPITITIGSDKTYSVDQARKQANRFIVQLDNGEDPREARRQERVKGLTLRELADEYVSRPGKLKPRTVEQYTRHVKTTFADMADRPVMEIDEAYCRSLYRRMRKGGLHGKRKNGSPGQANQAIATLNALLEYAKRVHRLPITFTARYVVLDDWVGLKARESFISASRIGYVWNHLMSERERAYNRADLSGVDLAAFMILSGCRIGEASELTWDRVNLEEAWWHLPDPKNNQAIWLPLSKQAVELLEQRPRVKDSNFVFPGKRRHDHIHDPRAVWERISKVAGEKIRSHDCRRTLVTNGFAELSIDFHKLELLSGHKLPGVTAAHYLSTKRLQYLLPELQRYADWIESQAEKAAGSNVVPLRA